MKLQDKVVVVTGAGGGIGKALVSGLITRGARVAAVDLRKEPLLELQQEFGADKVSIHAANISKRQAVESLPDSVIGAHGSVDGLINCAGIIQPFVKIQDLDYDVIEKVMNVNFYGTLYMTKAFLPHLLERPEACIANFSSMGGFLPVPGQGVYGASKAAVKLFSEALFAELLYTNVRVSTVFPGATKTNISQNSGVTAPSGSESEAKSFPMLTAEQSAEIVLSGIESNKPLIYTGKDAKMMNRLYRLNPVYATKLITKKMKSLLNS